jgi:hypothetical protein
MRTFLKVQMDTEAASNAIASGELPVIMQGLAERIKPESAFFSAEDGQRTGYFLFDLADPSDIPSIAEPLFRTMKAKISFAPAMNVEDLQSGLQKLG